MNETRFGISIWPQRQPPRLSLSDDKERVPYLVPSAHPRRRDSSENS